jgi:ribosomal protein L37AE/L43A
MAMNRVQFQRGLSLPEFVERFGSEAKCWRALEQARWPGGFCCPSCKGRAASEFVREGQRLWQCGHCRKQTSLTAGTPLANTKLALRIWFMAIYFVAQAKNGIAALELSRQLGVCYRTAWRLKHKLMAAMTERESGRLLKGLVQIDDAYLGGERSDVPNGKQWENKIPFVAAVSTQDGRPVHARFDCVSSFCRAALSRWAGSALDPEAIVVSDGLTAFTGIAQAGIEHERHVVGRGRRAARHPPLFWVNTILSNLKTSLSGTHHAFKFKKYAARYLTAHQYRFNRRFDLAALVPRMVVALIAAKPLTEQALRMAC